MQGCLSALVCKTKAIIEAFMRGLTQKYRTWMELHGMTNTLAYCTWTTVTIFIVENPINLSSFYFTLLH
jgi:hypothetical protein